MSAVEEKVDRLEKVLSEFIISVRESHLRTETELREFKDEMRVFKEEMSDFKEEMSDFKNWSQQNIKNMNKQWGELARKMGTITEDLVAPALRPVLSKYFNCDLKMEGQRIRKRIKGEEYEVDAIALCDDKVFMIEVRSTPKVEYLNEIIEKSKGFYDFFPEYRDKKLVIIFGSIVFPDNVIKYATKKKVYVMAYREWEYMDILNFDEIKRGS